MIRLLLAFVAMTGLFTASQAGAATLIITYDAPGDPYFTFTVDSNAPPAFSNSDSFSVAPVSITTNTGIYTAGATFYTLGGGGGIAFQNYTPALDPVFNLFGPQLFSGPTSNPIFQIGSFNIDPIAGENGGGILTITSAVPEPAAWAFMIIGFGAIGGAMRRRKHNLQVSYA